MVGVFFGSFDPPHIGHVNIVTAALNSGIVDKVIVVPAYKSVWKNTETKWEYRLTMAKETFDNIPGVVVDGIEYRIANGEPLPTYKTIEAIKEIYGEFIIVTSAETYKEIPRWQHGEEILKDNKFLVVDVAHFNSEDIPHDEVKVIYAPDITICSTAIRKWVGDGRIILPFVTDEVNSIIRKLGLYKWVKSMFQVLGLLLLEYSK